MPDGPRLEGQDPDAAPVYMTQPEGPRGVTTGFGNREFEVVYERDIFWIRSRHHFTDGGGGGPWTLWRQMDMATKPVPVERKPLQRRLYEGERASGWDPDLVNTFGEEIAHLHEEISEAFRRWRERKDCAMWFDADGKPQGVPAEFADVAIGMFYIAEWCGFDLMEAIETKHMFNLTRSYLAEGRQLHPGAPDERVP